MFGETKNAARFATITTALLLALGATPIAAHAQEVCTLANDPADRMPAENCDGCPEEGLTSGSVARPDGVFRLLNTVTDRGAIPIKNRKLAAVTSDAVRDALRDGADLGTRYNISDVGSIGVSAKINAILDDAQTDLQKEAARAGNVWLAHTVSAQAGANLGTTVPVGPHGFFVRTGIGAGGNFSVKVDKAYEPRVADVARRAIVNTLTVPFAAFDAENLKPGERVTIAGNGTVALSGGAGYGVDLGEVANIPGVRAGASVDAGTAHVINGNFETEVTRERGNSVRVKLRTNRSTDTSADFRAFAGITVDRSALELPVETGVSTIDNAIERPIANLAERLLSASFTTRHGDLDSTGDLQEYTFDLSRRQSRRAYEDALRGDFRAAAQLASCGGAGVGFVREINENVGRIYHNTRFNVSLLRYSIDSAATDTRRTIRDAAGIRTFEIHEYAYNRRNFVGGTSNVDVMAVNSLYGALGADGKSVHLKYRGNMENAFITSKSEMKDILEIGRAIAGPSDMTAHREMDGILRSPQSGNSFPFFWNRFGNTKMSLDLTVSESGIENIARASQADMWAAFAAPRRDEPMWATQEGRDRLERWNRTNHGPHNNNAGGPEAYWWSSYQRVKESIGDLSSIGRTTDRGARAAALRDAAQAMGDDFTAGAAIAILSGEENRSVKYGVKNEHVDYTYTRVGDYAAVRDPS